MRKDRKDISQSRTTVSYIFLKVMGGMAAAVIFIAGTAMKKTKENAGIFESRHAIVAAAEAESEAVEEDIESENNKETGEERITESEILPVENLSMDRVPETETETEKKMEAESEEKEKKDDGQTAAEEKTETAALPDVKESGCTEAEEKEEVPEPEVVSGKEENRQTEKKTESEEIFQTEIFAERTRTDEPEGRDENEYIAEEKVEAGSEITVEDKAETECGTAVESDAEIERDTAVEDETVSEAAAEVKAETESEIKEEVDAETEGETTEEACTESENEIAEEADAESENEATEEAEVKPESGTTEEAEAEPESGISTDGETEEGHELIDEARTDMESETEILSEIKELFSENIPGENAVLEQENFRKEEKKNFQNEAEAEKRAAQEENTTEKKAFQTDETLGKGRAGSNGAGKETETENSAQYRDANDRLWIRRDIINEEIGSKLCELGSTDENYHIDGDAPEADISVEGNLEGNQVFSKDGRISILIPPDAESGLKRAAYCIVPWDADGENAYEVEAEDWKSCSAQEVLEWNEEGLYCLYVRTEDQVGNVNFSKSEVFRVDHTPPSVVVQGVAARTANAGSLNISVECRDETGRQKLCRAELKGLNNGIVIRPTETVEADGSIRLIYPDFPQEQKYDDIYEMTVQVQDLAGNMTEEKVQFSVNRCGSVYDLSEDTRKNLQSYYLQEPFDIVVYETNVDYIGESTIFCRRDGILKELVKGRDYQVSVKGNTDSWKQYQYTIPADLLEKDGIYEILLTSTDMADNSSDTGMQKKKMTFAIDRTPPAFVVSGIEELGIYEADRATVHLQASDNICLKTVKVYRDSVLWKEFSGSDLNEAGGELILDLEEKNDWQTFQVYLEDAGGNFCWSREMPFYLSSNINKQSIPVYRKMKISAEETYSGKRLNNTETPEIPKRKSENQGIESILLGLCAALILAALSCGRFEQRASEQLYGGKRRKR